MQSLPPAPLTFTARRSGNRVLDALPDSDLVDIDSQVEIIEMRAHQSSSSIGLPLQHVHFPIDAVLSTIITLGGRSVEVGTIGNESFIEGDAALGATFAARSTICQVAGLVARMPIGIFQQRLESNSFSRLMRKNVAAAHFATQQYIACNSKHSDLARCARWLLMTADRAGRTQFVLSREFLGIMLGVPIDAMHAAVNELTALGAIAYTQARVSILDARLLEECSCECYRACKAAYAESVA